MRTNAHRVALVLTTALAQSFWAGPLALAQAPPPTDTSAAPSGSSDDVKHFGISATFEYGPNTNMQMSGFTTALGSQTINGKLQDMSLIASFAYRIAAGIQANAYVGSTLSSQFNASASYPGLTPPTTQINVNENWTFGNGLIYGLSVQMDIIKNSRFHAVPMLKWLNTSLGGSSATVSNSGAGANPLCTPYNFATNGPVGNCVTLGDNFAGGVMTTSFTETDFQALAYLGLDIGAIDSPFMTINAGVEEFYTIFAGSTVMTPAGQTATTESFNFGSSSSLNGWGQIIFHVGPVNLGADFHYPANLLISGIASVNF